MSFVSKEKNTFIASKHASQNKNLRINHKIVIQKIIAAFLEINDTRARRENPSPSTQIYKIIIIWGFY